MIEEFHFLILLEILLVIFQIYAMLSNKRSNQTFLK